MAEFTVTTLADETFEGSETSGAPDGNGLSLREALGLANANGDAEPDTIKFDPSLAAGVLFLQNGELAITTDGITIDGDIDGDGDADIGIDADSAFEVTNATSRLFLISDGDDLSSIAATLNGLVIRDGIAGLGGGILVGDADALVLTNATVRGNRASASGGGIFGGDGSSITLTNTTVSGNRGAVFGGGIFGGYGSSITLTNATVSGNSADYGGGIFGYDSGGGGIYGNPDSSTTLANSIVAGNNAGFGGDLRGSASAGLAFAGGNILGSEASGFGTVNGAPTATINGASQAALETVFAAVANNPNTGVLAGVLADNDGRVETIALNPDAANPAIDTGTGTLPADTHDLDGDGNTTETLPVDARGFARDVDFDGIPPTPDLGAFEQQNAVDFVVTTLADGGDDDFGGGDLAAEEADGDGLSLREALGLANGDPTNPNTITFDQSLDGGVLFLQSGELAIATDGITIDGDIDGDGAPDITIDADSASGLDDAASRVFLISGAGAGTIAAALNGLVIRDGNAGLGFGGGIHVQVADALTLTNATVSGNSADYGGGGIFGSSASSIVLTNTTVSGNSTSDEGGGIYGYTGSSIVLTNTTVAGNSSAAYGGGIFGGTGSSITLTNATVSNNGAGDDGGGIYSGNGSSVTLTNTTVSANTASNYGGGIFGNDGSSITLTNATVSGNSARYGGGIYGSLSSSIVLTNATVSGNSAAVDGGGIYGNFDSSVTLANSIVAGNDAVDLGDDLRGAVNARLTFGGGNILGSAASGFGGAVVGAPTATIDGASQAELETVFAAVAPNLHTGVLSGVLADNGGRVETIALNPDATNPAIDTGTATLPADTHDLDGDGNTAETLPVDARGLPRDVDFDGTPPTPDLGAFEQQNAADFVVTTLADGGDDDFGGGDLAAEEADGDGLSLREALGLANGDPTNPNAITFDQPLAGGVLFLQSSELRITTDGITIDGDIDGDGTADIDISADSAEGAGDAASRVFAISGPGVGTIAATLNGLVIRDGSAAGAFPVGGGIFVGQDNALTLTNATVSSNSAGDQRGGGIFGDSGSSIVLTNATVSGNSAEDGGGIFGSIASSIVLTNATVSGNSASFVGGGIAGDSGSSITLTNATVSGNSADYGGGGIYGNNGSSITLTNATVSGNSAVVGGGILGRDGSSIVLINATVSGNGADYGGGIYGDTGSSITLTNATVSGNSATDNGGGISGVNSSVTLANSIVAGNDAGVGDDLRGTPSAGLTFAGGNILGSAALGFGTVNGAPTATIDGASQTELETVFAQVANDPDTGVLSGVLANNGGAVDTIAIAGGGIAQNAGDNAALPADSADLDGDTDTAEQLPVDARGFARVVNLTVDIGAVELALENAAPVLDATKTPVLAAVAEDADAPGAAPAR